MGSYITSSSTGAEILMGAFSAVSGGLQYEVEVEEHAYRTFGIQTLKRMLTELSVFKGLFILWQAA